MKSTATRSRSDPSSLLSSGALPAGVRCPVLGSAVSDANRCNRVQGRAVRTVKGLDHLSCGEGLRELGVLSPEKSRLREVLTDLCERVVGENEDEGARLFSVVLGDISHSKTRECLSEHTRILLFYWGSNTGMGFLERLWNLWF